MKKIIPILMTLAIAISFFTVFSTNVQAAQSEAVHDSGEAADTSEASGESLVISAKAIASAIVVGLVGAGGALAMGTAIGKCAESMARQPEIASKINSTMMLGIVFIETAIIYALVIAILVIFVL